MQKVIHLEFKESVAENKHFYFGSKSAIFDTFTIEEIGISVKALYNNNLSTQPYENKKVIIRIGELKRKKGDRGIKKNMEK